MEIFPAFFIFCFVFLLGAVIGSFLNVVIFRYHSGVTFLGRSMCFSCGKTLRWHDLVPVLSFFVLGGKCRFCRSKISWHYAAVECITGVLFMLFFWKVGGVDALYGVMSGDIDMRYYIENLLLLFAIGGVLVALGGYDLKHKIIPDLFVYSFAALALMKLVFLPLSFSSSFLPTTWDFLAGPLLAFPFAFLWYVSGGRWMGFGDAKLALGIGWFLGLEAGLTAIIFSFWIGAIFGLALIAIGNLSKKPFFTSLFRHRVTMKSEIPFAPFLILGTLLVFFCGITLPL